MNSTFRRVILALTIAFGLYVGVWAEFFPHGFYTAFPGLGHHWIDMNGAFDEHLIRDVGTGELALTAISVAALFARTAGPSRLAGLGWTVYGVLHFAFHVVHLVGDPIDRVVVATSLAVAALLGIVLLLPSKTPSRTESDR